MKERNKFELTTRNFSMNLGRQTKIMGIVNATPDSFSHDGLWRKDKNFSKSILSYAQKLIQDGADILDVGGESTRPGSQRISVQEELDRVIPAVKILVSRVKVPISVDTYKPTVARHALDNGAEIINNIMGCKPDSALLKMISRYKAAVVLMHMRGIPRTMQKKISYNDFIPDVLRDLSESLERFLESGIPLQKILIDPGIGFGKKQEHNLGIIQKLSKFKIFNCPILVGPSRKSFIGNVLNKDVSSRIIGTIACVCASIANGAHIVRVHDVKAVKEASTMMDAILNPFFSR